MFVVGYCWCSPVEARNVILEIRSLSLDVPIPNAVVDLQSCHLGKFVSDENGKVRLDISYADSCVLYISSSGYISLVRLFNIPKGDSAIEMVFYMQKQEQYKTGRLLSALDQIPIQRVEVFQRRPDGTEELIGISDKNGYFGLVNQYSGQYHLVFRHPDFLTQEKVLFLHRNDSQLGSFFLEGNRPASVVVKEKSPKLTGIASKKFSFLGDQKNYIIVLGLYKGRENLPLETEERDVQFVEKGDWIRMFIGPYESEKKALLALEEVRQRFPRAVLKSE